MSNHILIDGKMYQLTDAQAEAIASAIRKTGVDVPKKVRLGDVPVGEVAKIDGQDFIILEHVGDLTYLITKDLIEERVKFSKVNNNYDGSLVDDLCESAAELLEDLVGADNVVKFELDLTSDDGLNDYGKIRRKMALITADMYRKYVDILDQHKINEWWWLATPHSTKRHENEDWAKCVSPSGHIYFDRFYYDFGVRPFCILKSHIFVSR